MISVDDYRFLRESLIEDTHHDFVGLWVIPKWIESIAPATEPEAVKSTTIRLVRELLEEGLIRAGYPSDTGDEFVQWSVPVQQVLDHINAEWSRLGRHPNIGEVVWFDVATPQTARGVRGADKQAND